MSSTLTFNPELAAILLGAISKKDWSNRIITALGDTRRLRCKRSDNGADPDVWANGTEFYNCALTGAMTVTAGNITGFGSTSGVIVRNAVLLSSGSAVLRIEGNNNWVQGTLGLPGSGADFIITGNPTSKTGMAFGTVAGLLAPRFLPSGNGPAAPALGADMVVAAELIDWTDPANLVSVGTVLLTDRDDDLVYEDDEKGNEIGDVGVYRPKNTLLWAGFEFGGVMALADQSLTEVGNVHLQQIALGFTPVNRWNSYPAMDTYNRLIPSTPVFTGTGNGILGYIKIITAHAVEETITLIAKDATTFSVVGSVHGTYPDAVWSNNGISNSAFTAATLFSSPRVDFVAGDKFVFTVKFRDSSARPEDTTYPPPFKVKLKRADGSVVYTHEMSDGLPVNSPALSQIWDESHVVRPHFNCGMLLPWQNTRTKRSKYAGKYYSGIQSGLLRPSAAKSGDSMLGTFPMGETYGSNGLAHIYAQPKWGLPADNDYGDFTVAAKSDPRTDPYLFDTSIYNNTRKSFRELGWGWEIAAPAGQEWYTGPGGPRPDRSVISAIYALWGTDPNGVRLQGNVPYREMVENYNLAYFNHSCHWLRDVKNFTTVPDQEIFDGSWVFGQAYYGGGPYDSGESKCILLKAVGQSGMRTPDLNDASGRMPWGGWALDDLHSYCQPGWATLMLNSPMHSILTKFRYNAEWMAALGGSKATAGPQGYFLVRTHAWRLLHYTMMWKLASRHRLLLPRSNVEARLQIELETQYDQIYVPAEINNDPSVYFTALRRFGQPGIVNNSSPDRVSSPGGILALYLAHMLVLMRQVGLWDVMLAKSQKCKTIMEYIIKCLDKYVVDWTLDTDCRTEDGGYPRFSPSKPVGYSWTAADLCQNWADVKVMLDRDFPVLLPTDPLVTDKAYGGKNDWRVMSDWVTRSDGVVNPDGYEQYVGQHMRYQYLCARRDYFSDYPNARLPDAIAKMKGFYDKVALSVASVSTPDAQRLKDWHYLVPPLAAMNPPVTV